MSMTFENTTRFITLCREMTINNKGSIVPLLLGETGIGKTELVKEYCEANGLDLIVIHVSQIEPADFTGLYKINRFGKTDNCQPSWLPYMEQYEYKELKEGGKLTPTEDKSLLAGGVINEKGGIVFLDEVNRGHEDIRQAMYQLINERKMHTFKLPEKYTIVAAANPTSGYETQEFDKALVNRFAWVDFKPSVEETLAYLEQEDGAEVNLFTQFLKKNSEMVVLGVDGQADNIDEMKVASPRILYQARIMYKLLCQQHADEKFLNESLKTILKKEDVSAFKAFLEKTSCAIDIEDIFNGKWKKEVEGYVKDQNMDIISIINERLAKFFLEYEFSTPRTKEQDKMFENVMAYLHTIPAESALAFVDNQVSDFYKTEDGKIFKTEPKNGKYKRITNEHHLLCQPEFGGGKETYSEKEFGSIIKAGKNLMKQAK